jgi:hypothetical protein
MYQLLPIKEPTLFNKNPIQSVINLETGWSIPFDPDNADYQEYLKWVAEGNTPTPADE